MSNMSLNTACHSEEMKIGDGVDVFFWGGRRKGKFEVGPELLMVRV